MPSRRRKKKLKQAAWKKAKEKEEKKAKEKEETTTNVNEEEEASVAKKKAVALKKASAEHTECRKPCLNMRDPRRTRCQLKCRNAYFDKKHKIEGKYVDHPVYGRLRY